MRRHTPEQIRSKLQEAETLVLGGENIDKVCRHIAVSKTTYYNWRREYDGLDNEQLKNCRELKRENIRLKRMMANLRLEKAVLERVAQGRFFTQ